VVVQPITAVVLVCAIGWRSPRWRALWLPVMVASGVVLTVWTHWYLGSLGVAGDPAPPLLGVWIAAAALAPAVVVLGWRGARWWRRGAAVVAVLLCALCVLLAVNAWVGYLPTVYTAWNQLTASPLPDQTDLAGVTGRQQTGARPAAGVCPAGSHLGRCVKVRPPPRTGVPTAGLVRQQPPSPVADRDDDRR